MTKSISLITHPSQLGALSALPFARQRGLGTLKLGGAIASHPDRSRWETELNRNFYACGCSAAAAGLLICLIAGAAWAAYQYGRDAWTLGMSAGTVFGLAIAGAIVGKLAGLMRADRRLKETVKEIRSSWVVEEKPQAERWTCG